MKFVDSIEQIPASHPPSPVPPGATALGANESPYPPFSSVQRAITEAVSGLNRYPDDATTELRAALSARHGVPADQISVGDGSVEILVAAARALLVPGREVVYAWPSFVVYQMLAPYTGARAVEIPLDGDYRHDLGAMAAAVGPDTSLVIVCNPNNPTSTAVTADDLKAFLGKIPSDVCVMIDEAYCEFNALDDTSATVALLADHPNVVLLRTFSKVYGMCGLRVGYSLAGTSDFPAAVDKLRLPFGSNSLAQMAAVIATQDADALDERVSQNADSRADLVGELRKLGLSPAESQSNFVWFATPGDSMPVFKALLESGIYVTPGDPIGGPGHLRITVGTPEENARLLEVLGPLVKSA